MPWIRSCLLHTLHFTQTLFQANPEPGFRSWVLVCLLAQSLWPRCQVMPQILTRLSEPRLRPNSPQFRSHWKLTHSVRLPWRRNRYRVAALPVDFYAWLSSLKLADWCEVPPGTTFPLRNLKYFITSVFSAVINLWHCNLLQREDSEQVLRSFKRINGSY